MTQPWTHTGYFYGLPVIFNKEYSNEGHGGEMAMRWTEWFWPVAVLANIHAFLNDLHDTDFQFKITNVKEIKK